jgi:hypothetical protein
VEKLRSSLRSPKTQMKTQEYDELKKKLEKETKLRLGKQAKMEFHYLLA